MQNLKSKQNQIVSYIFSFLSVVLITLLGHYARYVMAPENLVIFYLLAVVMAAIWWGRGPAVATSFLSVLAFDYFLVPPYFTFAVSDLQYIVTFAGLLFVGIVVSALASKTREQGIEARGREARTALLYRLSKDVAASDSLETVLSEVRKNVEEIFGCLSAVFLPVSGSLLDPGSFSPGFPVDEHEKTIAAWVFLNAKPAGWGTGTLSAAKAQYIPLTTSHGTIGVLGFFFKEDRKKLEVREEELLSALASQAAVAIQRVKLAEVSRQMELVRETEKLQTALLNSISHDLRTPLVSIMGALSSLLEEAKVDEKTRRELLETAFEESGNLNRLVGNLLDMTRVEAGTLKLRLKPCELRDVIGSALQFLKDKLEGRQITEDIAPDLPEIPMDFTLMMRVFINLIDNAVKYSHPEMPILISARLEEDTVRVEVKDRGFGIPDEDLTRIFDKFYRAVRPRQVTGTGLGLSICKGFVEAHGGTIFARNNPDKGATLTVILPLSAKGK
jgi:two-component system sensor histidine kinase KdpD